MKAWRFYGFGDMRLDDVPEPVCRPGHVIAEPLCVQPSVTEAQLAFGIPTLAYEAIKRRLETEAPVQLFGHEFCARVVEVGEGVDAGSAGRSRGGAGEAALRLLPLLPRRQEPPLPQGTDHRLSASRLFRRAGPPPRDRAGARGRSDLGQRGRLLAIPQRQRRGRRDRRHRHRRFGRDLRAGEHGTGVPPDRPLQRGGADRHRGRARGGLPGLPRARGGRRRECPGRRSRRRHPAS